MPRDLPDTIYSDRVPTEYDIEEDRVGFGIRHPRTGRVLMTRAVPFSRHVVLVDDRNRRFRGLTLKSAFARAERGQDPSDPIHHPPFPSLRKAPLR